MKLTAGNTFPNFTVNTQCRNGIQTNDLLDRKTIFWVIRYIGCTVCRYDVHVLSENWQTINDKGYNLFVVMQSDPEHIHKEMEDTKLPFEIICDNTMEIYKTLEINPAATKEELRGDDVEKLQVKGTKARELGFSHGDYEGDELQLPALFIVDTDGTVLTAHYGRNITDMPTVDELIKML